MGKNKEVGPKKERSWETETGQAGFSHYIKKAPVICFQQRIWGLNTKNTELQRVHDGLNRDYNLITILHWGKLGFDNHLRVQLVKWAAWVFYIGGRREETWPVDYLFFLNINVYVVKVENHSAVRHGFQPITQVSEKKHLDWEFIAIIYIVACLTKQNISQIDWVLLFCWIYWFSTGWFTKGLHVQLHSASLNTNQFDKLSCTIICFVQLAPLFPVFEITLSCWCYTFWLGTGSHESLACLSLKKKQL